MSELLINRTRNAFDPWIHSLSVVRHPTAGASAIAQKIEGELRRIRDNRSPTVGQSWSGKAKARSLPERLHDSLGAAKVLLSQVSMHLEREWRDKLFRQLDTLLDPDSWDEGDDVLDSSSFSTFLRMVVYLGVTQRPALGASSRGHLLADWTVDGNSLTVEFLPKDEVRWIVTHIVDGDRESATGQTHVGRLGRVLAPYEADRWLRAHANQPKY